MVWEALPADGIVAVRSAQRFRHIPRRTLSESLHDIHRPAKSGVVREEQSHHAMRCAVLAGKIKPGVSGLCPQCPVCRHRE